MKKASKLSRLVSCLTFKTKCTYNVWQFVDGNLNLDLKVRRRESKRDRGSGGVARNVSNASAQVSTWIHICVCICIRRSIFIWVEGVSRSFFVSVFVSVVVSYGQMREPWRRVNYFRCSSNMSNLILFHRMNRAMETVAAALMDRSRLLSHSLRWKSQSEVLMRNIYRFSC